MKILLSWINRYLSFLGFILVIELEGENYGNGYFRFTEEGDCKIYFDLVSNHRKN
jgi:hypothetical protein